MKRVVVTGLGLVTSLSCKVEDCFQRILAGESGIHQLRLFDVSDFQVQIGGDVYDWDASAVIDRKEIKRLDRVTQFALVAAADAVIDAGIDFEKIDPVQAGVILGSGIGGFITTAEQNERLIKRGPDRVSPFTIPKLMLNAAGANLSIKYGLRGQNYSVATACASATNAMGDAFRSIRMGNASIVMTGGAEAALTRMGLAAFQNMKALSGRNDEPAKASRPFDLDRDGFLFSEGAGLLIFEELEHARARGAKIYAEIVGYGSSGDAYHITQPDQSGTGAATTMQLALEDAQLSNDKIDYINAHGTSTPLGDIAETRAIKSVFGEHAKKLSVSSTKSQIGHTLGASGGIELVFSCKAITDSVVPPTSNLETPDPECDLDYTPNQAKEREIQYAMSNSFGFGGHNASIIAAKFNG